MIEAIKKKPVLSFALFIVLWTWILMAVIIALVPVDPIAGPQFVHVAIVFFVASPSVFGFIFTRIVDGKRAFANYFREPGDGEFIRSGTQSHCCSSRQSSV